MNDTVNRHRERASQDREVLYAILDAIPAGTLSTVVEGRPWVVPMLFARDGDQVILHGSTGAGALRHVAAGAPAAFSVLSVDGLVVAHSTFESSANYRSAVVHGHLTPLHGEQKWRVLDLLSDRLIPGRTGEVPAMTDKEVAATLAMLLPITDGQWTVKTRTGPPSTPEGPAVGPDGEPVWQGVVARRVVFGPPEPAPWVPAEVAVPVSVRRLTGDATDAS